MLPQRYFSPVPGGCFEEEHRVRICGQALRAREEPPQKYFKPKIRPGIAGSEGLGRGGGRGGLGWFRRTLGRVASLPIPLGPSLRSVAALWWPCAPQISLSPGEEDWRRISGCRCTRASEVGQGKATAQCADFLLLAANVVTAARSSISDLGLSPKPDTSGQPSSQMNMISNHLCKGCDIRTIWKN